MPPLCPLQRRDISPLVKPVEGEDEASPKLLCSSPPLILDAERGFPNFLSSKEDKIVQGDRQASFSISYLTSPCLQEMNSPLSSSVPTASTHAEDSSLFHAHSPPNPSFLYITDEKRSSQAFTLESSSLSPSSLFPSDSSPVSSPSSSPRSRHVTSSSSLRRLSFESSSPPYVIPSQERRPIHKCRPVEGRNEEEEGRSRMMLRNAQSKETVLSSLQPQAVTTPETVPPFSSSSSSSSVSSSSPSDKDVSVKSIRDAEKALSILRQLLPPPPSTAISLSVSSSSPFSLHSRPPLLSSSSSSSVSGDVCSSAPPPQVSACLEEGVKQEVHDSLDPATSSSSPSSSSSTHADVSLSLSSSSPSSSSSCAPQTREEEDDGQIEDEAQQHVSSCSSSSVCFLSSSSSSSLGSSSSPLLKGSKVSSGEEEKKEEENAKSSRSPAGLFVGHYIDIEHLSPHGDVKERKKFRFSHKGGEGEEEWRERTRNLPHLHVVEKYLLSLVCNPSPSASSYPDLSKRAARSILEILRVYVHLEEDRQKQKENIEREERTNEAPSSETQAESYITPCPCSNTCISSSLYSPSEALLQKREEIVASRGDREGDRKYEANLYQENVAFLSAEEKSERNLGLSMDERQEEKDEGSEEDEKTKRVYFRCQSDKKRKEVTQGKEEVEIEEESFVETEDCTSSRYVDLSRFLSSLLFIHERTLFKRVSLLDLPSSSSSRYFTDHVTLSCSSFSSLVLVQPVLYELLLDALNLLSFLPRWKDAVSRIASSSMYLYLSCFPSWRKMSHQETSSSSASSFPPFYSSLKETILSGEISEERTQIGDVSSSLSPRSKRSIDTLFPLQSLLLSCRARHPTGSPQIEEKRACLLRRLLCEESEGIHLLVDRLHELLLPPMKRMVDSGDKRRNLVTHVSHNEVFSLSSYLHSSEIKRRKGENGERKDPCSCPTGLDWNGEISLHSKKEREEERAKGGKNFVLLSVYLYFLSLLCSPDQTYIAKQATSLSLAWFLILFQPSSSSSFLSSSREQRSSDFLLYPPSLFLRLLFQQIVSVLRPFLLTGEREEERDDRADSRGRGREDEERVKEEKEEEVQGEASHAVVLGFLYLLESLSHLLCEFLLVSSSTASSSSFLQHERTHPIEEEEKKKKDSTDREIPGSNFVHERTLEQEKEEDQESHLSSATEPVDGKKNERSKEFSSACRDGLQERICSTLLSLQAPAVLTAFSLCDSSFLSFSSSSSSSVSLCPSLSSLSSPSFSSSLTSSFSSSFSSFCDSLPSPLPVHCIAAAAYGKLVKAVSSLYDQMGEANDGEMHKTSLRLLYNEVKRITCTAFEQKITSSSSSSSSSLSSPLHAGEKMKEVLSVGNARERRRRESLDEEADKIHRQVSADCVGTMTESSEKLSGQVKEKKNEEEEEKDVRERRRKEEKSLEEELRVLRHEEEERRKKEREDEGEEEREEEETDDRRVLLKDREEEMPKKKERCHRNTQQVFSFNPIDGRRTVEKFENLSFFFSLLSSSLLRWNPSVYSSFIHFILGLFLTFSSADDFPHPHSSLCSFSSSSSSSPFSSSRRKSRRRCHRLLTKKGLDALRGAVSPHDSSVDSRDFWRRLFLDLYTPSSSSSSREKKNTSPHEKEEEKNKKRREDEGCRELEKEWSHTREVRRVKRNSKEKRQESCHEISDVLPADGVKVWSSVFLWMSHVVREVSGEEDIGVSGVCTPPPQGMKKEKSRDILRRKKKLDEDEKHISKNVGRKKNRENFCRRRPSFVDSFVIEGGEGSLLEDLAEGILLAWWGGLVHALMEVQLKAKQEEIKENSEEEEEEKKGFSLSKRKKKKERETKEEEEERERRNGKREEEERKKTRGEQVERDEKKERGKKMRTSITVEEENEREHEKESECVSSSSSPSRLTSHCGLGLDNLKGDDRSVWVLFAFLPFQFVENLLSSTEILSQRFVLDQIGSREEERGRDEEEEKRRRSFLLLDFLWSLLSTCIRCISHILFSSLPELFGSSCLPSSFSLGRKGGSFSFSPPHLYSSLLRSFATLVHTRVLPLLHFSASHLSLSAPISTTSPFLSMLRLFSLSPSLSPSPFSSCSSSLSFLLRLPSSFSETFSSQTPPSLLLQTFPFISGETPDHTSMKEHRHSLQHHCRHKDDLLLLDGISKSSFTSSSSLSHTFSPLSSSSSLFSFLQILIFRCCDALIHLDVPPERRKCTAFSPHLFSSLQQGRSIQPSTHEKEEEEADSNIPNTSTPSSSFSSSLLPPLSSAPHPFRLSAIPSMKTPCPSQDISCAYEVLRDSLRVFKSLLLLPSLLSSSSSPFFSSSALHRHSRVAMLLKLLSKREGLFLGEVTREKNQIEREEERERIRWLWTSLLHVGTYYTDLRSDILQLAYEILEISRGREGSVDVEKDLVQEEEQEIQEEEERDGGTKKTEEDSDIAVVEEMKKKKKEEEDEEEERRRELRRGSVLWKTIVIEAGGLRSEYKAIVEDVLLHFFHIRDIAREKEKEVKWRSKEEEESEEKRKKDDTMKGKAEKEEKKKNRLFDAAIQLLTLRSLGGEGRRKEEKIQLKREEDEIDRQEDMSDDPGEDQIDVKEEKDEVEREEEKEEARRKGSDRFEKQEEEEESEGSNLIAWLYREGEEREEEVLYLLSLLIRQLLKKRKDEGQGEEGEEKLRWIERREKEDMILLHGKLRQAYQVEAHERKTPQPIQETFVDWPVDCACDRCREADHVDCLDE
ncbi:hypothetical protein CSUI_002125 [Cystoisospora suis]|uniref:Uncharacterized protein n=1 Tax=Cystoisospora suis TaxID=483139 RepID=A0A2C6LAD9_9APIC|nr:hypothetical protein CSUI_002125 [Cystoisospora suis]